MLSAECICEEKCPVNDPAAIRVTSGGETRNYENQFLLDIGFTKIEIAHVGKSFGIGAMIVGGLMAGVLLSHRPLRQTMLICAGLQFTSALLFLVQAQLGNNIYMLFATIGVDNFSNGMGFAAFITYLSIISRKSKLVGASFALLTSIASFARVIFSYFSGYAADHMLWSNYYILTAIVCIPSFVLVLLSTRSFKAMRQEALQQI